MGQKRSKRDTRDSRETTPVMADRPSSSDNTTNASLANHSPTNNNIKTPSASGTRQDTTGTRNRNARTDASGKNHSNMLENWDFRGARSTSPPLESKTFSGMKDSKLKNVAVVKNSTDAVGNTSRKVTEAKKATTDEGRRTERSKSYPENLNDEIISVVVPNKCESAPKRDLKDSKEPKGKQKRKLKALNRKDEKDKKGKTKESTAAKSKDDEGVMSDDSCSDGSSDKSVPEVRIQQPSKEGNRTHQLASASRETADSGSGKDRGKNRKNGTENAGAKPKKGDGQSASSAGRPKSLDVPAKNQNFGQHGKNQNNSNHLESGKTSDMQHPGATSPHAIAAAVMSLALGKNMQAPSKENSFDEHELSKRKAYTKTSSLCTNLSDSPPPTSPTQLSGSSRSSSYSSIVSSDSSNGTEQVKQSGRKGNKLRVKTTKSLPMEGGTSPTWTSAGNTIWNINVINPVRLSHK